MELKTMLNHMIIYHTTLNRIPLLLIFLLAATLIPLAVTAGVYKWTDKEGNVHYGSQRPADATAERLKIKSSSQPYADKSVADDSKEDTKKDPDKAEEAEKPEAVAPEPPKEPKVSRKEKQARCQQARKSYDTIVSRGRVRVQLEDGSSRHMTDKERSKRLAQAKKNVAKYCR
jgi:hypothetical protein